MESYMYLFIFAWLFWIASVGLAFITPLKNFEIVWFVNFLGWVAFFIGIVAKLS